MKEMVGWEEFVGSMGIDEKTPAGVCRQGFWIFGMSTWDTFGWRNNRAGGLAIVFCNDWVSDTGEECA
jgi:hypothetical protein